MDQQNEFSVQNFNKKQHKRNSNQYYLLNLLKKNMI